MSDRVKVRRVRVSVRQGLEVLSVSAFVHEVPILIQMYGPGNVYLEREEFKLGRAVKQYDGDGNVVSETHMEDPSQSFDVDVRQEFARLEMAWGRGRDGARVVSGTYRDEMALRRFIDQEADGVLAMLQQRAAERRAPADDPAYRLDATTISKWLRQLGVDDASSKPELPMSVLRATLVLKLVEVLTVRGLTVPVMDTDRQLHEAFALVPPAQAATPKKAGK